MLDEDKTFSINELGDTSLDSKTGEAVRFVGVFVVKRVLSKREEIAADIFRRQILGPDPLNSMASISNDAYVMGQLSVRIIKAPSWWEQSNGGLELKDNNILAKIYEEAMKAEFEYRQALIDLSAPAEKVLEKIAKKDMVSAVIKDETEAEE